MKKIKKFAPGRTSPAAKLLSIFLTATVIWWFWGERIKGFLGMGEKPSAKQESIKTEAPAESSGKDADSKKGLSEQIEQINQRISGFASSLSAVQEEMDRGLNEALKASDMVLFPEVTAREGLFEKGYKSDFHQCISLVVSQHGNSLKNPPHYNFCISSIVMDAEMSCAQHTSCERTSFVSKLTQSREQVIDLDWFLRDTMSSQYLPHSTDCINEGEELSSIDRWFLRLLKIFSGEKPKGEYLIRGEELDRIAKQMTDMGYKPYYTRDSGNIKMMYIREGSPEGGR